MRICTAFAIAMLAACAAAAAQDLNVCEFRRVVDVQQRTFVDQMPWYAGESVGYTVVARRDGDVVQIPAGSVPVWLVLDAATNAYVVSTGTVVSATNGEVRFWLPAPEANLPAGDYRSYASVYQGTNRVGVLDRATVRVSWRPGDDFEAAAPVTNLLDQVALWHAEAMAAIVAETAARTNAGYLTAELDASGLAAAGQVQTNLDALASTSIVAVSVGGFYYPDYFTLDPITHAYTATDLGTTSEYNSVQIQWRTYESARGYLLEPQVLRQADWEDAVAYSGLENLEIVETNGQTVAAWADGVESGTVGRITATLGGYSRSMELTANLGAPWSNEWWVADLPGSLRESINTAAVARASAAGAGQYVYLPGAYNATNFLRDTNFFAADVDLTCASAWNSYRYTNSAGAVHNAMGNYHAGTAITPQHIAYAAHWICPTGTAFRFVDATNGIHDRMLVDQRILPNDIAIGLLDTPLGSEVAPAKILPADGLSYLRGRYGQRGAPGIRLMCLDQWERAIPLRSSIMENITMLWPVDAGFSGDPDLPYYREEAIGGDSGNPVFLLIQDFAGAWQVVLFSTYRSPRSGPFIPGNRSAIEAAMADMGNSVYTNLTAVDLTGWTNYDAGANLPDY